MIITYDARGSGIVAGGTNESEIIPQMEKLGFVFKVNGDGVPKTSLPDGWSMRDHWNSKTPDAEKRVEFTGPDDRRIIFRPTPPEGQNHFEFV